jgi:hypothetical protein
MPAGDPCDSPRRVQVWRGYGFPGARVSEMAIPGGSKCRAQAWIRAIDELCT